MGQAIKGSVSPWLTALDNSLLQVFAGYIALGIVWMLWDRSRARMVARVAARA